MNIVIVPIENEHSDAVVDLILNIQQKEFNVSITLEDQPDLLEINSFYHKRGGCFWGAFADGELVGTIALVKYDDSREGAIRKMFVKKAYRGKELFIAQQLLNTLIEFSKQNDVNDLYLGTISVLEAALRFYERNDFVRIEKESLPVAFPVMGADNVFCHLKLS